MAFTEFSVKTVEPLETVLEEDQRVVDGGYQEEIDRLQLELVTLDERTGT